MKVEVITGFFDLKEQKERLAGQIFECDSERVQELKNRGLVELVEPVEAAPTKNKRSPKKKD